MRFLHLWALEEALKIYVGCGTVVEATAQGILCRRNTPACVTVGPLFRFPNVSVPSPVSSLERIPVLHVSRLTHRAISR
jgi:hypothetical protein